MATLELIFMVTGFAIASYSIVGNDAIQTLGTFLASNEKRPWWVLWLFASGIMAVVLIGGWFMYDGDPAWERLGKYPMPEHFSWLYVVPPLVLLVLTRFGLPVSTTFLVLTVFAAKNLPSMLIKSLSGYALAFILGVVVYLGITKLVEKHFIDTKDRPIPPFWFALQWVSTAFLWVMWLIQDLANIYVYLPRKLTLPYLLGSLAIMVAIQAYIFYTRGGAIQKIVTSKTNTQDIRAATIIDFLFGAVLLIFKEGYVMALVTWASTGEYPTEMPKIPMSTTWVFLGLLAGREVAMNVHLNIRSWRNLGVLIGSDAAKAMAGLAVSVVIAMGLPYLKDAVDKTVETPAAKAAPTDADPPALPDGANPPDEAPAPPDAAPSPGSAAAGD